MNSIHDEGFILTNGDSVEKDFLDHMGLVICFEDKLNENNLILLRKVGFRFEKQFASIASNKNKFT